MVSNLFDPRFLPFTSCNQYGTMVSFETKCYFFYQLIWIVGRKLQMYIIKTIINQYNLPPGIC